MLPSNQGAFRLFKVSGIEVLLHWSWFLIAYYQYQRGKSGYINTIWMVWEIIGLFGIVLLHEFGHSLACRSVGGRADRIILWPFGGIAFVQPPHRPGAFLWSIAAGPLVNVLLIPVIMLVKMWAASSGVAPMYSDAWNFLETIDLINKGLLIFNILPIYPLDGGQILQSVLWFFVGYTMSVMIAAGIGLLAGVGLAIYGFGSGSIWMGMIAIFILSQAYQGFKSARELRALEQEQRRGGVIDV